MKKNPLTQCLTLNPIVLLAFQQHSASMLSQKQVKAAGENSGKGKQEKKISWLCDVSPKIIHTTTFLVGVAGIAPRTASIIL